MRERGTNALVKKAKPQTSSQIKIFTCSTVKQLIFHFIILIKRGLCFKGVVDTSCCPDCYVSFLFLLRHILWHQKHSLLNVTYHQFVYESWGFLKIAHLKALDLPIWFSLLLLFCIEKTQIGNEEGRCEEKKIFYSGKYLCGNDEGVHHQEEKWAEFLMYKPEIQSCMCQMDMSEKVTVVFFHFMTQSDSYQSHIRPIKIMDISYSIDLIRQL